MRGFLAALAVLAPLCWLAGCDSPETAVFPQEPVGLSPDSAGDSLRINEIKVLGINDLAGRHFDGALEIANIGDTLIHLSSYFVRTDTVDIWRLPNVTLEPGEFYVARSLDAVGGSSTTFLSHATRAVALLDHRTGRVLDRLDIPASVWGGVLARYPNGLGSAYVYPLDRASLGTMNPDIGFVRKLAAGAEFSQRDSSPNAILTYSGYHWILGGWSNFGGDEWHSFTDVWQSSDGIRWWLVNAAPPYVHYSAFVAWKGRMWAIGPSSFSSEDGIEWRREPIEAPALGRAVVFRDSLVSIHGSTVMATEDGERWTTLTDTGPWGSDRVQPTVLVYDDKIWVMGGTGGVTDEVYFNDVWTSADGMTWSLVNPYSDWTPRLWTSGVVYDGKIFVINGMSLTEWFEEYGQTAEIWFTEDGVEWFQLEAELKWAVRHASLTTVDEQNGLLLLAGYGLGGVERLYNDVWSLRAKIFFSKAQGDLRDLDTWGKRKDGSGESPASFDAPDQVFVLRNRDSFAIDESWSVTGAGSRIFVGDGQRTHSVELQILNRRPPHQPLYLLANSTTIVSGCPPSVLFKHPQAALIGGAAQCDGDGTDEEDEHTE